MIRKIVSARSLKKIRGFSLTEIAIVLGIIGLILGAIWSAASMVSDSQKIQQAEKQISTIVTAYRDLFKERGVNTAAAIGTDVTCMGVKNNYFPPEMRNPAACVDGNGATYPNNQWQGTVTVTVLKNVQTVRVTYFSLPQSACIKLALHISSIDGFRYMAINNATDNTGFLPPLGVGAPFTLAQIDSFCVPGNGNWIFADYAIR